MPLGVFLLFLFAALVVFVFALEFPEGRIVALCGVIGSGKTVMLRRLQQQLKEENRITVSRYRESCA